MKYFVSYAEVFNNDDTSKRETLRLQAYRLTVKFLTRKQIEGNYIIQELNQLKDFFSSKQFTDIYFLSPYIINHRKLVDDIMVLIMSSGETNSFLKIYKEVLEEVREIKSGKYLTKIHRIHVSSADEFLEKFFNDPSCADKLVLDDKQERSILEENINHGILEGNILLTLLGLRLALLKVQDSKDLEDILDRALSLEKRAKYDGYVAMLLGDIYSNYYCKIKDREKKIIEWYSAAAAQNIIEAYYLVGLMYFTGTGTNKDDEKALKAFSMGAEKGSIDACSALGVYYLSHKQKDKAKIYLQKSAEAGDNKALLLLDTDFDRK